MSEGGHPPPLEQWESWELTASSAAGRLCRDTSLLHTREPIALYEGLLEKMPLSYGSPLFQRLCPQP